MSCIVVICYISVCGFSDHIWHVIVKLFLKIYCNDLRFFFAQLSEKYHAQCSRNPTQILTALNFINIQTYNNNNNNINR